MIKLSSILSKDFPFVRVDFYLVNNKIYFEELNFTPGSGFEQFQPYEDDLEIASLINLEDYN